MLHSIKREQLKNFLKKWPVSYCFLRKIYHIIRFRHLAEILVGTKVRKREWATRHLRKGKSDDWGKESNDWIKGYWDSQDYPHRQFLVEKISTCSPILSILEVGCNCGPNLVLLAKKFPNAKIRGIDVNPVAVQKGNEWLLQEGISNVKLLVGRADELE